MNYNNMREELDFGTHIKRSVYLPFLYGSILMGFHIFLFAPKNMFLEFKIDFYVVFSLWILLYIIQAFIIMPAMIKRKVSKISKDIDSIENGEVTFTQQEITDIFENVLQQPRFTSRCIFIINFVANLLLYFTLLIFYSRKLGENQGMHFLIFSSAISALYTGLFSYYSSTKVCSRTNKILSLNELDESKIMQKKHFGSTILKKLVQNVLLPWFSMVLAIVCIVVLLLIELNPNPLKIICSLIIQTFFTILLSIKYRHITIDEILIVNEALDKVTSLENNSLSNKTDEIEFLYDLNLDISYTSFMISRFIKKMKKFSSESDESAKTILSISQKFEKDLQNTAEILNMEDSSVSNAISLLKQIETLMAEIDNHISSVAITSTNTLNSINSSTITLSENMTKIEEITQSNIETISGIKDLSDRIEEVWAVIATIDSITEKTRTIAFNAEIETSTLGDTAENFHIVANEIRRLADSVTDSTLAIRNKITSIQHASDNLVITSEGGTEKIREESELFTNLEEKFEEIKLSGQVTKESTEHITQFLQDQKKSLDELSSKIYELKSCCANFQNCTKAIISSNNIIQSILMQEEINGE